MMSVSAGAMETAAEFVNKLRVKALSEIWLSPDNFGLSARLPWPDYLWRDLRWALSHYFAISEAQIDQPPTDGIVVYDGNWCLVSSERNGHFCPKLVRINQPA